MKRSADSKKLSRVYRSGKQDKIGVDSGAHAKTETMVDEGRIEILLVAMGGTWPMAKMPARLTSWCGRLS
jgi:hypothetical protein